MKNKGFWGYKSAVGCFFILFTSLGFLTSAGVLAPYQAEYVNCEFGMIAWQVTFSTVGGFCGTLIMPKLIQKLTARWTLLLGTVLLASKFILFANPWGYTAYWIGAFIGGIAMGIGTNACCASLLGDWFIEKRSAVIGAVFGGAGFGAAFFSYVNGWLAANLGIVKTYYISMLLILAVGAGANLLLIRDPKKIGQKPLGWEKAEAETKKAAALGGLSIAEARRSPALWIACIAVFCCGPMITGFQQFSPKFWQTEGMVAITASAWTSLFSAIGATMTIVMGIVANKFGNKLYLAITFGAYIVGMIFVIMTPSAGVDSWVVLGTVIAVGISYALGTSLPATITTDTFGRKDYTAILAYMTSALYLGKAVTAPIMNTAYNLKGTYAASFTVLMVLAILSLILAETALFISPFAKLKKKQEQENQ